MIQEAQEIARQTLAASAAFQSLVGAGNATDAALRIYHDELPRPASGLSEHSLDELNILRPCAIIYTATGPSGFVSVRDAMGDVDCWHNSGTIVIVIMRNVPIADKNDLSLVDTAFRTIAGTIVSELIEISETASYLACDRIEAMGPYRTDIKDLKSIGDAQSYELIVSWGNR